MLPYEAVRVVLVLRALFVTSAPDQLICPVNLPLTDLSLVVRVFQGEGHNQPLLEGLCAFAELPAGQVLLDPALFVEDPVKIELLVELVQVVFRLIISRKLPAIRSERKIL